MVNRRQFLSAATAAAAATFARVPTAFGGQATKYDLLIKGGRVIDPSVRLDAVRDVAIAGGRIAAVEPSIAANAAETIDARGKIVAPGLIDIHTHAGRSKEGPALLAQDGVTGWVDAGSAGADAPTALSQGIGDAFLAVSGLAALAGVIALVILPSAAIFIPKLRLAPRVAMH